MRFTINCRALSPDERLELEGVRPPALRRDAFRRSRSFLPVIPTLTRVPGAAQHEAKRNGALQTRDRYGPRRTPAVMVRRMAQDYVSSYRIPMSARSGASETTPRARVR